MPQQYGHDMDLMGVWQLLRAKAQVLASDPSGLGTSDEGRFWYNSTTKTYKIWSGTVAVDFRDISTSTGNLPVSRVTGAAATSVTRLDQFVAPTSAVGFGNQRLTSLADGTASGDAVNLAQLDVVRALAASAANGIAIKPAVRAVDTVGVTQNGTQTVDSIALAVGDRYLRAVGSSAANAIWVVQSGAHTRPTDADGAGELGPGTQVAVTEGALSAQSGGNADSIWRIVSDVAITPGTTAHSWERLPGQQGEVGVGGAGLTKTGSTYDVGQGDGVLVDADAIRVNPNRVTRKRTGVLPAASGTVTCDDGTTMAVSISGSTAPVTVGLTHNLAAPGCDVRFYYHTSPGTGNTQGQEHKPDTTNAGDGMSSSAIFGFVPAANQLRFQIEG